VPHRESVREADALRFWDGRGAVRLLAAAGTNLLLLERCVPGTPLGREDLDVAAQVLRALHRPAPLGFRSLAAEARRWERTIPAKGYERPLVDRALGLLRELAPTQGEAVVLHQDLHAGNILLGERGWLAIDPKPLAGEREFDVVALARNAPDPPRCVRELAARLELDRERAHGWAYVQALAWDNVEVARALYNP
jgi:streptomycin 6-kinase